MDPQIRQNRLTAEEAAAMQERDDELAEQQRQFLEHLQKTPVPDPSGSIVSLPVKCLLSITLSTIIFLYL